MSSPQKPYQYPKVTGVRTFGAVIVERDEAGVWVGHVPDWPGAHSQGKRTVSSTVGPSLSEMQNVLTFNWFVAPSTISPAIVLNITARRPAASSRRRSYLDRA